MPRSRPWVGEPLLLALLLGLACWSLGALGDQRAHLGAFQAVWLAAFAVYGIAIARRGHWREIPHAGALVIVVALVLRVAMLTAPPSLSDDVSRYLWDGRMLASGMDPYRYAPLDFGDNAVDPHLNHPDLRTIYPPVAQLGFAIASLALPGVLGWKLWVLGHDLLLCILLVWWCKRRCGSAWHAAVYAWNPLVVVEYAGNGHHDPTGIVWLVLALALADLKPPRAVGSALGVAAAVGVKLVALPAAVFLWRGWTKPARVAGAVVILGMLGAYAVLATGPRSGLTAFAEHWRHNDALFGWLAYALGERGARIACALAVGATVVAAWRERLETVAATRLVLRAGLLLGPVVHPWYLGWVLALEPLKPSAPWLLLSCTVTLGYGAFAPPVEGGGYHPALGWRAIEYGLPLLLAIALTWWRNASKGRDVVRTAARGGAPGDER